jgi:hypothetical protein
MTFRAYVALAAAAIIAAPVVAAPPPNPWSDALGKLSDLQRRAVLRRAVLDNGLPCKTVTQSQLQGRWKNLVMWTARCMPGGDYGVYVGNEGSVQVRRCSQARQLGLPVCRMAVATRR